MIAALDVHYDESRRRARAAAVVFEKWEDAEPVGEYVADVENVEPYVPGELFRRELPCLLAVVARIEVKLDIIVIDGYVRLNEKSGLGQYLYTVLVRKMPAVGVAKTRFTGAPAREVFRGGSSIPLFVTAAGIESSDAADCVARMHGPYRIPTLLKRVDRLARD